MNVMRVIPSGYCKGVISAIKIVKDTRNKYPKDNIYILGMIVHNSFVSEELNKLGVITLDDSKKTKAELLDEINEGVVIFTAHGISEKIKNKAIEKGLICVDASCEDVLKTQNIIKEYLNKGYDVVYFGKDKHPEAEAVIAISNKIHLVTTPKDIEDLTLTNPKLFFTNQTTMSYLELEEVINQIKVKYPSIIIQEEICNATSSRQQAINKIENCDLLYVVGDVKSNNTRKLVDIGIQKGIKKVLLIQSKKDIHDEDLININNIYVTAGASTPPQLIDEVIDYLRSKPSK